MNSAALGDALALPINGLRPMVKLLLLTCLPLCIFSDHLAPTLIALAILAWPWRGSTLPLRALSKWAALAILAGLVSLAIAFGLSSGPVPALLSLRISLTVVLLGLTALRFERALSTLDILHIGANLGGHRAVVIPLISAHRMADMLGSLARNGLNSARARSMATGKLRTMLGLLLTFFMAFFELVDTLSLALDMRLGTEGRIMIRRPGHPGVLDVVATAFSLLFTLGCVLL